MPTSVPDPSLRDLGRVVSRHKKKVCGFVFLTLVVAAGIILATPKTYKSEAKLFVKVGRESIALDPTAATGQTVQVFTSREIELNSVVAMLSSRAIAEKVVDRLGPEEILAAPPCPGWVQTVCAQVPRFKQLIKQTLKLEASAGSPGNQPSSRTALAVTRLMESIEVSAPKNSTVIDVSCKAHSPELAQEIVDTMVDVYTVEHARFNRTSGSEEFFREQTGFVGNQLAAAKSRLSDMKNKLGIDSIEGQRAILSSKKSSIVQRQVDTAALRASSLATANALRNAIDSLDKEVIANRVSGRPQSATDGIRQALFNLEVKERELREKYAADHPYVVAVRKQVESLREVFESEQDSRSETTYTLNANRQKLELDLTVEEARLAGLEATAGILDEQYAAVVQQLQEFNTSAVTIGDLETQIALLENDFKNHANNLELARIDTELQRRGITNVNTVQAATLPEEPSGPGRAVLAGLALIAAVFGGIVLAFVAEYLDETVKSPAEAEKVGSLPVLATLPRSRRMCVSI